MKFYKSVSSSLRDKRSRKERTAINYLKIHDMAMVVALNNVGFGAARIKRLYEIRADVLREFVSDLDVDNNAKYGYSKLEEETKCILGDLAGIDSL